MTIPRSLLLSIGSLSLAMAVTVTTRAAEPRQANDAVPDGTVNEISDWALAGLVWSDASLANKLAAEAAKRSDSPDDVQRYRSIADQSARIINELEAFGWKQVKRSNGKTANSAAGDALPTPEAVGAAVADSLGRPASDSETPSSQRDQQAKRETPARDPRLKRFDTESPAGADDPGLDDERTGDEARLDIDQYRVDDYIDETATEARNRADAVEDGVEAAIAAAAGRRAVSGPVAGYISEREVQTRSATMPYSKDSIYDRDDYDPDADYDVNNPAGTKFTNRESVDLSDGDDEIDLNDPARVIDGEDELIAAMQRESGDQAESTTSRRQARTVDMRRYTTGKAPHQHDANWVQFHINVNQAIWSEHTTRDNLYQRADEAFSKLKIDAAAAADASSNPELVKVLQSIAD
ncbi:hypothetical protein Mal15_16610 [Stieleria maiorica]|uniref:Uncharacterized protein n=1 Tax=Stieleria maiorica TaxID=2795974 RepID=A0A5B9MC72_9BACT|nr:hypothetical protein [Stieleria maiorica]QEF97620.1 hypothetical protein Mal15_16610 [Stieleria maiorica]